MTSKNILIVSPEIPHPVYKGNQNRIDQTIRLLKDQGYTVNLAILNNNQKERKSTNIENELKAEYGGIGSVIVRRHPKFNSSSKNKIIWKLKNSIFKNNKICNYDSCPRNFKKAVRNQINKTKPDIIIVNYLRIADVIPRSFKGIKIIDTHDLSTDIMKADLKLSKRKNFNLLEYEESERKWLNKFDKVIAINPREEIEFKSRFGVRECHTIPSFHKIDNNKIITHFNYDILFVGSASPFNIEGFLKFNAKAIPILKRTIGHAPKVALVGDICNSQAIKNLKDAHITKLGRVKDLSEIYQQSKLVVCPLLSGAGMKIKLVEALSYGKAIVSTPVGADGVKITNGIHAIITESWSEFANATKKILESDEIRSKLESNALSLAKEEYSYDSVRDKWHSLLKNSEYSPSSSIEINDKKETKKSSTNRNMSSYKEEKKPLKRTKCLLFGTDANTLMKFNLDLAIRFKQLGVYSEIFKSSKENKNFFMSEGFITHSIKEIEAKEYKAIAEAWYDKNKEKKLHELYYRDINIGLEIDIHKNMFPEHFEGVKHHKAIIHAIVLIETLLALSEKINPDFFVSWNGNGPHLIYIPKIVAAILKKPIIFMERGLLPDSYILDKQGVNFKSNLAGSYTPTLTKERLTIAENYIAKFFSSNNTVVQSQEKTYQSKEEIMSHLNCSKDGYIFFPEQIEGDSNIIINSPKFKKMADVIEELILVAKENDLDIIVRPHPENKKNKMIYPDGVHICNDIHLHSLLKNSEFNVTINSTVGLESLLLKKPTFVLGNSIYSGKSFTFDVRGADEINKIYKRFNYIDFNKMQCLFHSFLSEIITSNSVFTNKPVDDSLTHKMLNELLKNLGLDSRLRTTPSPNKACTDLVIKSKRLKNIISTNSNLTIINTISDETLLYYTGSHKPNFDINKIIEQITPKAELIDISNRKNIKHSILDAIKKTQTPTILIIKNNSNLVKTLQIEAEKKYNILIVDEYFIVQ